MKTSRFLLALGSTRLNTALLPTCRQKTELVSRTRARRHAAPETRTQRFLPGALLETKFLTCQGVSRWSAGDLAGSGMSMISVVIPAYNEQEEIANTVQATAAVLRSARLEPFEIIVVDDGSSDATGANAESAGARVVTHIHNLGYGRSLKDGIAASRYDTVLITDADGTYPLAEIPALVAEYRRGFDMVVGARTGEHYRESFIKSPMRKVLKWLVEFTAGRSIPDINSGLRVFSRKTMMPYFTHLCETFSFTTSATLAYMMTSRTVAYINIPYHERVGTTKIRLLRDSLRTPRHGSPAAGPCGARPTDPV